MDNSLPGQVANDGSDRGGALKGERWACASLLELGKPVGRFGEDYFAAAALEEADGSIFLRQEERFGFEEKHRAGFGFQARAEIIFANDLELHVRAAELVRNFLRLAICPAHPFPKREEQEGLGH